MGTKAKQILRKIGAAGLGCCLLTGVMGGMPVWALEENAFIQGVPNEENGYIEYVIGADAPDTVVLDGTTMEQFLLNKAWDENPRSWMPGDTSVGRMAIRNQSGAAYRVSDVKVSILSPADLEGVTFPDGYDIKGPDGEQIPVDFVQHRIPSKPLAALYDLDSALDLTLDQLVNAEAEIAEKFAGTDVKTYADYLCWYIKDNAEAIAKSWSKNAKVQEEMIAGIDAASRFSELPDNAVFWLQKSGNAAVSATDEEVAAVAAGNPKATVYGHRDSKNGPRYYIYEFDEEVAQTVYAIQFRKLIFFSFDHEQYPVILENKASKDNPDMAMIDHLKKQGAAADSTEAVLGNKEIGAGESLELDNVAYHISVSMNNNYQLTALSFMFTITLEKVKSAYSIEYYQDAVDAEHLLGVESGIEAGVGDTITFPQDMLDKYRPANGYQSGELQTDATVVIDADPANNVFRVLYVAEEEEIPDESTPLTPTPPTEEEIPDEDTPLDGNPETGEPDGYLPVYMVLLSAAAAVISMTAILLSKKRRAGTNS